jgi:hypothetical protein
MLIRGSCHCGNISFELNWLPDPTEIPARACNCSFCTKHGGVWTSLPTGSLRISIEEPALVSKYAFGTGTARFDICGCCGVVPVVTSETNGRLYAVVNVNTFNDFPRSLLRPAPVSFEDEDLESRLARRTRNWIADVRYFDAGDRAGESGLSGAARTG